MPEEMIPEVEAASPMIVDAANREYNIRVLLAKERRRADNAEKRIIALETELNALKSKTEKPRAVA